MAKGKGQVPFEPTEDDRLLVAVLIGSGMPQEIVCRFIKWPAIALHHDAGKAIGLKTLRKAFREELDSGMSIANGKVIQALFYNAVVKNNVTAQIWWTKCRAGWKEPAQDVNLHKTWGELVEESYDRPPAPPALTVIAGGKPSP